MAKCVGTFGARSVSGMAGGIQYHFGRNGQIAGRRSKGVYRRSPAQLYFQEAVKVGNQFWQNLSASDKADWNSLLETPDSGRKLYISSGVSFAMGEFAIIPEYAFPASIYQNLRFRVPFVRSANYSIINLQVSYPDYLFAAADDICNSLNCIRIYLQPAIPSRSYADPAKFKISNSFAPYDGTVCPLPFNNCDNLWVKLVQFDMRSGLEIDSALFKIVSGNAVMVEQYDGPKYKRFLK